MKNKLKGNQHKLDKNKDGKISGADFKMMKSGGPAKIVRGKVRGGGAATKGLGFNISPN
jgi:hypothetical protein